MYIRFEMIENLDTFITQLIEQFKYLLIYKSVFLGNLIILMQLEVYIKLTRLNYNLDCILSILKALLINSIFITDSQVKKTGK